MPPAPALSARPAELTDEELVLRLLEAGDRLPRLWVDECVRRGTRLIPFLADLISEERYWQGDSPDFWAPIHATYIVGAIGGEDAVKPLIMSLRMAHTSDCDWVYDLMPDILSTLGRPAVFLLRSLLEDDTNHWHVRAIAADALGQIADALPSHEGRVLFDVLASVLRNSREDRTLRGLIAHTLLDARQRCYQGSLMEFAREEERTKSVLPLYLTHLDTRDIERALAGDKPSFLKRDWLRFYSEEEVTARQKRWHEEARWRSWWFRPVRPFARWARIRNMRKTIDAFLQKERQGQGAAAT